MNHTQVQIQAFLDRYLISVQKPGRYIGGEFNQVLKAWDEINVKVALAFPDVYDIGFSNMGMAILYDIINQQKTMLAERVYAPWLDFESLLKEHGIPLFTLESKNPLRFFDLIGFTLPYETLYTNLINMLHLANIPILSKDREDDDPIILAGGHACYNPEPMHAFIDMFAIGEGEEVILEILRQYARGRKNHLSRQEIIQSMAEIEGVYIPGHYRVAHGDNGKIKNVQKQFKPNEFYIRKRVLEKLPPPPTRFLVPNIRVVHDRVAVEIMRGCSRGCRFCQAGFITRPVRQRSNEEILQAISETVQQTGYEEVALLSLSSSDFSRINDLIQEINVRSRDLKYSFSLPSLRIETFDDALVQSMQDRKKGNFTIAPESASEFIRNQINKPISDQDLLAAVEKIFSMGWQNIKLYYMIGFPNESLEDVRKIATMCNQVYMLGKRVLQKKVKIHVSINTFIPKPHTPFQWAKFAAREEIEEKYRLIRDEIAFSGIKLDWSDYESSLLEACLSRGDRRLSRVIETAWRNGCKFDAWHEQFRFDLWSDAFQSNGLNMQSDASGERSLHDVLPWDHIQTGVQKDYLIREYEKSRELEITPDCRDRCHACGIQFFCTQNCAQLRAAG